MKKTSMFHYSVSKMSSTQTSTDVKNVEEMGFFELLNELIDGMVGSPREMIQKMNICIFLLSISFFGLSFFSESTQFSILWGIGGLLTVLFAISANLVIPGYLDFKDKLTKEEQEKNKFTNNNLNHIDDLIEDKSDQVRQRLLSK